MKQWSLSCVLVVLAFCASCASNKAEPAGDWQIAEIESPSDRVLWKISLQALQKMGYPLGAGMDPGEMHVESGWKVDLHPFSGRGQRTLAVLDMRPKESGVWTVEARVKRQLNEELARPLDPRFADWQWDADDTDSARILLQHIRSALDPTFQTRERPADPVTDYRRRSGR